MRSSVDTLRREADALWEARQRRDDPYGLIGLTPEQSREWSLRHIGVIEATITEHEYLNSLLEKPLTEEDRDAIVRDLFSEEVDSGIEEADRTIDYEHMSDWSLVRDHEAYLEARASDGS